MILPHTLDTYSFYCLHMSHPPSDHPFCFPRPPERGELGGVVGSHGRRGASHTTLIVRLREDTDLALSPIMLEAATRYCRGLGDSVLGYG